MIHDSKFKLSGIRYDSWFNFHGNNNKV